MNKEYDELYHAININVDRCIGCSHCIKVCPTEALHIWNGHSNLNPERCIDCDECYRACPVGAIEVEDDGLKQIEEFKTRVALIPSVFLGQFQAGIKARDIFKAVQKLGFNYVYEVEESSGLLEQLISTKIKNKENLPLISSFCPAVLRLIQVNFPQLTENIIRLQTPVDITARSVRKKLKDKEDVGIFYFTPCSAKITSLKAPIGEHKSVLDGVINIDCIFNKVQNILISRELEIHTAEKHISNNAISPDNILWSLSGGESKNLPGTCLSIDGTKNAISFLDKIETQGCRSIDFLEIKNCDQGCAGGILTPQNRFLTAQRLRNRAKYYEEYYMDNPEIKPKNHVEGLTYKEVQTNEIKPRSIVKFDSSPLKALQRLQEIQRINKMLPELDCGACGYPTCKSLAQNISEEKAKAEYCFVIQRSMEDEGKLSAEESKEILEKIWGEEKFNI